MERIPDVTPELPARSWRLILAALARLPQASLSRTFGQHRRHPAPPAPAQPVLGGFARAVGIDLSEAERPLGEYGSLNEFFVRRLRAGAREWPGDEQVLASPVDGITGQGGRIEAGRLIQAKGRLYSAADLLADPVGAERFEGGEFLTIYLSPRHYHRIHAPVGGIISEARHVPGALLPVNEPAVLHVADLFARNERLICHIDSPLGRVAVVAVGAYNVGRISAAFDAEWSGQGGSTIDPRPSVTNRRGARESAHVYDPPIPVAQGDEIMAFHLGSTVVLLTEPGVKPSPGLVPGVSVQLGQILAASSSPTN
jgi:phosphatidylserine decarboxylase